MGLGKRLKAAIAATIFTGAVEGGKMIDKEVNPPAKEGEQHEVFKPESGVIREPGLQDGVGHLDEGRTVSRR